MQYYRIVYVDNSFLNLKDCLLFSNFIFNESIFIYTSNSDLSIENIQCYYNEFIKAFFLNSSNTKAKQSNISFFLNDSLFYQNLGSNLINVFSNEGYLNVFLENLQIFGNILSGCAFELSGVLFIDIYDVYSENNLVLHIFGIKQIKALTLDVFKCLNNSGLQLNTCLYCGGCLQIFNFENAFIRNMAVKDCFSKIQTPGIILSNKNILSSYVEIVNFIGMNNVFRSTVSVLLYGGCFSFENIFYIQIISSWFFNNTLDLRKNTYGGSVLFFAFKKGILYIKDSYFQSNQAYKGSLSFYFIGSNLTVENCFFSSLEPIDISQSSPFLVMGIVKFLHVQNSIFEKITTNTGFFLLTDSPSTNIIFDNISMLYNYGGKATNGIYIGSETNNKIINWKNSKIASNYNYANWGFLSFIYIQTKINKLLINFENNSLIHNNLLPDYKSFCFIVWVYSNNFEFMIKNCQFIDNQNIKVLASVYGLQNQPPFSYVSCYFYNNTFQRIIEADRINFTFSYTKIIYLKNYLGTIIYISNSLIAIRENYFENMEIVRLPWAIISAGSICDIENIVFKNSNFSYIMINIINAHSFNIRNAYFENIRSQTIFKIYNSKYPKYIKNIVMQSCLINNIIILIKDIIEISNWNLEKNLFGYVIDVSRNSFCNISNFVHDNNFPLNKVMVFLKIHNSFLEIVNLFFNFLEIEDILSPIQSKNSNLTITSSTFLGNTSLNYFFSIYKGEFYLLSCECIISGLFFLIQNTHIFIHHSNLISDLQRNNLSYPVLFKNCLSVYIFNTTFNNFSSIESPISIGADKYSISHFVIRNSFFKNLKSLSNGSILLINSRVEISNSLFFNNTAFGNGGAIYLRCDIEYIKYCNYSLINNIFQNNKAKSYGGAYFWQYSKPKEEGNIFIENQAIIYGENYASPFFRIGFQLVQIIDSDENSKEKIIFDSIEINSTNQLYIRNKQKFDKKLFFKLYPLDFYAQKTNKTENVIVTAVLKKTLNEKTENQASCNMSIYGVTSHVNYNSEHAFIFDNLFLKLCPKQNISLIFQIALKFGYYYKFEKKNSMNEFYNNTIYFIDIPVILESCIQGEVFDYDKFLCSKCPQNYFSVNPEDQRCQQCLKNAFCPGGFEIILNFNYWRSSNTSLNIYECDSYLENCIGGFPALCSENYEGVLCNQCNNNLEKNLYGECIECPNIIMNIFLNLLIFGSLILLLFIVRNFASTKNYSQEKMFFLKVLIDYLHFLYLTFQIDRDPLKSYWEIYYIQKMFRIFSLNCLLKNIFNEDYHYIQMSANLIYFYLGLFIVFLIKIISPHEKIINRKILHTYLYVVYPFFLSISIRNLICMEIDNDFVLAVDTSLSCDDFTYILIKLFLFIPTIIFLVFGLPFMYFIDFYRDSQNNFKTFAKSLINLILSKKKVFKKKRRILLKDILFFVEKTVLIILNNAEYSKNNKIFVIILVLYFFYMFSIYVHRSQNKIIKAFIILMKTIFVFNKYCFAWILVNFNEITAILLFALIGILKIFFVLLSFIIYVNYIKKFKKNYFEEDESKNVALGYFKKKEILEI